MAYAHLSIKEREIIEGLLGLGHSFREIGALLKRCHSSISRELTRNNMTRKTYRAAKADALAELRRLTPNHSKKRDNKDLYELVITWLEAEFSPDVISGLLRRLLPEVPSMHVSHETIYQWVYKDYIAGGNIYRYLPKQNKRRKPHSKYSSFQGAPRDRKSIHERPDKVNERLEEGHWEGDLIVGSRQSGYILTLVERKTRYVLAEKLESKDATIVSQAITTLFYSVPNKLLKTLTLDNGKEFFNFKEIENQLPIKVYYADPYCSGQRGSNENLNGIIRRTFHKKFLFTNVTDKGLQNLIDKINFKPRKILGYLSAAELFFRLESGALAF